MSSALEDVYGGVGGGGDDDCDGGDDEWGVGKTWSQEENPDRGHSDRAVPLPPSAIGIELN